MEPGSASGAQRRIALVMGGGGLKGFAHIGVLRALQELGIEPTLYAGTSIGALIAAAHCTGMPVEEMDKRARSLRRRDLFRINHMGMLLERMHSPSIYLEDPLRNVVESIVPRRRFDELRTPLLVNTVDLERATQVVWGLPGLRDVDVADAVYASCALPGYFPPGRVDGRWCIDGGVIDNLPAQIAAFGMDAVIAVDVGSFDIEPSSGVTTHGFASIYMRSATTMMHALQQMPLGQWDGPPMVLIRPRLGDVGWLSFGDPGRVLDAGYQAAMDALRELGTCLDAPGGIYPRRTVQVEVDKEKCIGCTLCAAIAPRIMGMDPSSGKAFVRAPMLEWSPADGDFVRQCPTQAIIARNVAQRDGRALLVRPAVTATR